MTSTRILNIILLSAFAGVSRSRSVEHRLRIATCAALSGFVLCGATAGLAARSACQLLGSLAAVAVIDQPGFLIVGGFLYSGASSASGLWIRLGQTTRLSAAVAVILYVTGARGADKIPIKRERSQAHSRGGAPHAELKHGRTAIRFRAPSRRACGAAQPASRGRDHLTVERKILRALARRILELSRDPTLA